MNKKELLEKLEELNTVPFLRKNMYDEYRQILNDLEQMGVPPLSHTLQNDEDRNVPLTDFTEDQINVKLRNTLIRNGIKTVGSLLDLNRLDTIDFAGFGDRKWGVLYRLQQTIYNSLTTHKESDGEVHETLPLYDVQELTSIHQEMLDLELLYANGEKWDKNRYQALLIGLNKRGQKRSDIYKDEAIDEVSIDVLELNPRLKKLVESLNYDRMVQIMDITESTVLAVPHQGRKSWTEIIELKKEITDSQAYYLEKYKKYYMVRELPETTDGLPLYKKVTLAMSQLAEILETRGLKRNAYILKEYFINGASIEDVRDKLAQKGDPLDKERIRQITSGMQECLMSGSDNPLIDNAYLNDEFVSELNALSQDIVYCPVSYTNHVLQAPDNFDVTPILRLLSLDVLEITNDRKPFMDAPRIISTDDIRDFVTKHIKAVYYVMSLFAMPATKDDIISEVMSSNYMPANGDINVVEKILTHHSWVDCNNDKYTFQYDKLKTAEAKAARLVYERQDITTTEIKDIDAKIMNVRPESGMKISAARIIQKYPWVARGAKNNELIYSPNRVSTILPLRAAIERYAKKEVKFNFRDMVAYLKTKGYDNYAEGSFRAYVLKYCVPSNNDKNLLCLESEIQNHNSGTWRNRSVQGTTNWVINSCVKILGDKKLKKAELNKRVIGQPEADGYNIHNIYALNLYNYFCSHDDVKPNKLFITQGDYIWVNKQCIDEGLVDLETIGSGNRTPDYYMDVLTEIVNQLKQTSDYRMKLVHLKQKCISLIPHPSKDTVFYKIMTKLPEEVEKVEIDGTVYLQLKTEKLAYEKTYSLPEKAQDVTTDNEAEVYEPEVVETTKPEKVYVRGKIDWGDMASELKSELTYYNRWWDVKGITLGEGVDKFVDFLENTSDGVLHGEVSRHIFEFLTQKLDRYDLHDHMKSIVFGVEPLIRSIYMLNNPLNSCPSTCGLSDSIALIPQMQYWVDDIYYYRNGQKYHDFRKTFLDLRSVRNKLAHGVSVEMNTVGKYQATYGYLAFYIYLYCRFVNK